MSKREIPNGMTAVIRCHKPQVNDFDYRRETKFPVGTLVRCKSVMLTLWSEDHKMICNMRRGDMGIVIDSDRLPRDALLLTPFGVGLFDWDALEPVP
jgi:hypothetical protein